MTEASVQRIETVVVSQRIPIAILVLVVLVAPWIVYPVFAMKALCFALFACAFNLLLGYAGLLSFGHALFFGGASYASAHAALVWGWPPELAVLFSMLVGAALGLVVGLIAGWLASHLMKGRGYGCLGDTLVGVVGALIGGFLAGLLGLQAGSWLGQIIVAALGGVVLVWILHLLHPGVAHY